MAAWRPKSYQKNDVMSLPSSIRAGFLGLRAGYSRRALDKKLTIRPLYE
jgi:hypothetical protein